MEPQIRYAKTSDGVSIAYYTIGSGAPYIWLGAPQGIPIADQWRIPELQEIMEGIARRVTLIVYDPRGAGLSDGGPTDYSCEAMVRDLEAVADAASPEPFTLQTFGYMSVPALAYAERHPDRVVALVLLNGIGCGADMSESWRRLVRLADEDWEDAKVLLVRTNEASYSSSATVAEIERLGVYGGSKNAFLAFSQALETWDASECAARVETPALVAHYGAQSTHVPREACRRLAAALPRGTFASGEPRDRTETQLDRTSAVVRTFLRGVVPRTERTVAPREGPSGTAIILFTDIVDSTPLTERMGDTAFREASRKVDAAVREAIRDAGGTPVTGKVMGDGVMGVFTSAASAIDAARRCVEASKELPLHIGLHAGDVTREQDNVYGGAVNIASRICGLCEPGEILVSATVRELARTSAGVMFEERGEQVLKGIKEPVRVYAVRSHT